MQLFAASGDHHDQRSYRHRRRSANADGRLPGRFRRARGERSWRGGDPGGGFACGSEARRRRESDLRVRAAGRARPGAGAPGGDQGGTAARHRLHDGQQDVRLGDGSGDARARRPCRRHERGHRRRRDGEHVERAVSAAEGARRLSDGASGRAGPHVPRRPRGCLRQGPAHGDVRRGVRGKIRIYPRGAGRVRAGVAFARARREQRRHVRAGKRRRSPSRAARATS